MSQFEVSQKENSCYHGFWNTCPKHSSRSWGERLDLIDRVFERCRRLELRPPSLSDLDDFLDGRTSLAPPVSDKTVNPNVK